MHSRVTSPHSRPSTASMSALPPSGPSSKTGNAYGSSAFLARSNASIGRFCFGSLQKIRHCRGPSCLCPPHAQRMPELKRRADRRFSALVKSMIVAIILPELQPCDAREWNRHIVQPVCVGTGEPRVERAATTETSTAVMGAQTIANLSTGSLATTSALVGRPPCEVCACRCIPRLC